MEFVDIELSVESVDVELSELLELVFCKYTGDLLLGISVKLWSIYAFIEGI